MLITLVALIALIANFERVADFLERMDKRGSKRLGLFSTTLGVLCLVAAVVIQLIFDERALARSLAGLGTLATSLGLPWLVSRWRQKPKRCQPRKRKPRPRPSIASVRPKLLPLGRLSPSSASARKTAAKRSRATKQ